MKLTAFILLALLLFGCGRQQEPTVYVNPATTTPQFAWLQAEATGALRVLGRIERKEWRSGVQFQSLLLGKRGDFWIGSVETMARARQAGAPVQLLLVTGWRKWVLVGHEDVSWQAALKQEIYTAPPGNPGATWLRAAVPECRSLHFMEGRQLVLALLQGKVKTALLAEPLASQVLLKNRSLKRLAALEDIKAEVTGGAARLPWAGIAVNEASPLAGRASWVVEALCKASDQLKQMDTEAVVSLWPSVFEATLSRDVVKASLQEIEQPFDVLTAAEAEAEIRDYLKMVAPDVVWDPQLLWKGTK